MDECSFKSKYWNFESHKEIEFECKNNAQLESDKCIFHDRHFLEIKENRKLIVKEFQDKIDKYLSTKNDEPLFCIGYRLYDINIRGKKFAKSVYFDEAIIIGSLKISSAFMAYVSFHGVEFAGGDVDFSGVEFSGKASVHFSDAKFSNQGYVYFVDAEFLNEGDVYFGGAKFSGKGDVSFSSAEFSGKGNVYFSAAEFLGEGDVSFFGAKFSKKGDVDFSYAKFVGVVYFSDCTFECNVFFGRVNFMSPNEVRFETEDLTNVSFMSSDITKILIHENARFGKLESREERFKILDERIFVKFVTEEKDTAKNLETERVPLGNVVASYRNLRENYEYRLRYDEAGQFFVREMEMKRKYREKLSSSEKRYIPKENCWLRRNFSLTGLYYHLSRYGESISRPIILGIIIVGLSTLFWLIQNNPTGEPCIPYITDIKLDEKTSVDDCINFTRISNNTHISKAFERSLADFLPLLSMPSDTKIGIIDFVVKIIGGGLTFVLLGVALRRKFERKYTR